MKDLDFKKSMKGLDFEPIDHLNNKGKLVKATKLPSQVVVMPKLNGVRMRWNPTKEALYTNNGNRVGSCDHIVGQIMANEELRKWPLDGESYWHGPEYTFSYINGKTRRKQSSKETEFLQFHIFDLALYDYASMEKLNRLEFIKKMFGQGSVGNKLLRVPYGVLAPADIPQAFKATLEKGYEGVMIFNPTAPYTEGKQAGTAWKWKPTHSREDAFVGFEYATEGRNVGTFAAIRLRMEDGQEFTCAGISDDRKLALLKNPPHVGEPCTIEFGDLSDSGVPIFPRFVDTRWDEQ